jgi:hypothetical protein
MFVASMLALSLMKRAQQLALKTLLDENLRHVKHVKDPSRAGLVCTSRLGDSRELSIAVKRSLFKIASPKPPLHKL